MQHSYDTHEPAPAALWMPIVKAEEEKDGRLRVWGLASDHRVDLDGEIIKASDNPKSLTYGFTKFDLNHNSVKGGPIVGDVESLRILKHADAKHKYKEWLAAKPGRKIVGDPVEIEGFVYPMGKIPTDDLKTVHHYHDVGCGLGFSLFGAPRPGTTFTSVNGKMVPTRVPAWISTIAITPQPKNDGSACFIAKSLQGALTGDDDLIEGVFDMDTAQWIVLGENESPIYKGMGGPGGDDAALAVGTGENLVEPHLSGPGERACPHCGTSTGLVMNFCPQCGKTLPKGIDTPARVAARHMVKSLRRSLQDQRAAFGLEVRRGEIRAALHSMQNRVAQGHS